MIETAGIEKGLNSGNLKKTLISLHGSKGNMKKYNEFSKFQKMICKVGRWLLT